MTLNTFYIILQQTLIITTLVLGMMMVIEFINVRTGGLWSNKLQSKPWFQILFAIIMGIIPGCLGTYTVVSLYVHRVLNFPALMAALISTTGDEAFFMFSLFPEKALLINLILIVLSIIVAVILQLTMKNKFIGLHKEMSFPIHENESCSHTHHHEHSVKSNIKNISFVRALLITMSLGVLIMVLSGVIDGSHHLNLLMGGQTEESVIHSLESHQVAESPSHQDDCHNHSQQVNKSTSQQVDCHSHNHSLQVNETTSQQVDCHNHSLQVNETISQQVDCHSHNHNHSHGGEADWIRIILIVLFVTILIIVVVAEEHFLEEHLWQHVIKVHLPKIFLWTFGVILCLTIINNFVNIHEIIDSKPFIVLLVAILIGLIPQSGPHLIFLILFANGDLPLGIFLANCIVQDGHGALPLLAESRKAFFVSKGIKVVIAILVGVIF
ncbi:MAG: arsenic efflux protein [Bacteroidales bacterium]|nr:arsenic efflux protein [Bacteroidales bacterium]